MKVILFPGQGAQSKGMGRELFLRYPKQTKIASEILGYSLEKLCLEDPDNVLRLTQYTQPALYVVNALDYFNRQDNGDFKTPPDFFAGHSLGEYNALLAAEAFDFETGLRLVKKRGELMGSSGKGSMAAVIGVQAEELKKILSANNLTEIDLANFNTPTQTVISGKTEDIRQAEKILTAQKIRCILLMVSASFHSRYMKETQKVFSEFLRGYTLNDPKIPVIANINARPYQPGQTAETLIRQIASSVLWTETIRYLLVRGEMEFIEIGNNILTKMVNEIQKTEKPLIIADEPDNQQAASSDMIIQNQANHTKIKTYEPLTTDNTEIKSPIQMNTTGNINFNNLFSAEKLGSSVFRQRYGIKYAYMTGGMFRGVASKELVVRMGKAGLMAYFGTGGLSLNVIEEAIQFIQKELTRGEAYGMNLLANLANPLMEEETVKLYLKYGIRNIEAAAYMMITPALVLYRLKGLRKNPDGTIRSDHNLMAKLSRPEVAEIFMSSPPEKIVRKLLSEGKITPEEAELSKRIPVSPTICVEADSGGHTDMGIPTVLIPSIKKLKEEICNRYNYQETICLGQAGGIGTPDAAAAAFIMGADFILTGSINQCTVEGGISPEVKNMLQVINVQDTAYAPAGDLFELGAKVQVLKKGVFFPARANKLYSLYTQYNSLDELPLKTKEQLEERYFKKSFAQIWQETKAYFYNEGLQNEINKAENNPKHKMALVFRWYFGFSTRVAFDGDEKFRVDYQVQTGPALGAFNQWVKGTSLEKWQNRHVDEIAEKLMQETAQYFNRSIEKMLISAHSKSTFSVAL